MPCRDPVGHNPRALPAVHSAPGPPSLLASVRSHPGPAPGPSAPGPPCGARAAPGVACAARAASACRGWCPAGGPGGPPVPLLALRGSPPVPPREGWTRGRRQPTPGGAWGRRRPTRQGGGGRGTPPRARCGRGTSARAAAHGRKPWGLRSRQSRPTRPRGLPLPRQGTRGAARRRVPKPARPEPAPPPTARAATPRCGTASHASSATHAPAPRRWRPPAVPSSSFFATPTWRKRQHYLCSTTGQVDACGRRTDALVLQLCPGTLDTPG